MIKNKYINQQKKKNLQYQKVIKMIEKKREKKMIGVKYIKVYYRRRFFWKESSASKETFFYLFIFFRDI